LYTAIFEKKKWIKLERRSERAFMTDLLGCV